MQGSVTYWVEISQHQLLRVKGQGMLLDKSNQKFKIRQSNCLETVSCGGPKSLGVSRDVLQFCSILQLSHHTSIIPEHGSQTAYIKLGNLLANHFGCLLALFWAHI
jgi:hypothetical protein